MRPEIVTIYHIWVVHNIILSHFLLLKFLSPVTGSQHHRRADVGRTSVIHLIQPPTQAGPWNMSRPIFSISKDGENCSGQPVPVLSHPHSIKECLLHWGAQNWTQFQKWNCTPHVQYKSTCSFCSVNEYLQTHSVCSSNTALENCVWLKSIAFKELDAGWYLWLKQKCIFLV